MALFCDGIEVLAAAVYPGQSKSPSSFTVLDNYFAVQMFRLTLGAGQRATIQGTGDLILSDDFGNGRNRITLSGGPT